MLIARLLDKQERELIMIFKSFNFKHGIPINADYLFNVHFY